MKKLFLLLFVNLLLSQAASAKLFGVDLENILSDNNININIGSKNRDYSKYRYNEEEDIEYKSKTDSSIHNDESLRIQAYEYSEDEQDYKAVELYEKSLEYNKSNEKTWHGYCWSLIKLKRFNEAGKACGTAINLANNSKSWWLLGWNYEKQKNNDYAIKCYDEALKINPNNREASYAYFDLKTRMFSKYEGNSLYRVDTDFTSLRIRKYPEYGSKIRGKLKNGDIVNVIKKSSNRIKIKGKSGHWVLLKKGKKLGYAFSAYLSKVGNDNVERDEKERKKSVPIENGFTIQAGSFSSQKSAADFSKNLKNSDSFVFLESSSGRYIVGIGSFKNRSNAKGKIPDLKIKYENIGFFVKSLE